MKDYIVESNKRILKEWREWSVFRKTPITVINNFNSNIEITNIISYIENILKNKKYISNVEEIFIGSFSELNNRKIQAMYKDGVIYVSNSENNPSITEEIIGKDIIHEIGHSLEDKYGLEIYGDHLIENEFLGKRKRLYDLLSYEGINIPKELFLYNLEYSIELDNILYNEIGYNKLNNLIMGLFLSPYCVTSISEYFSNGFEEYKTGDLNFLKSLSPILYKKLNLLDHLINKN